MDGAGGPNVGEGAAELVTCGRDGCVKVWDIRQKDRPVAIIQAEDGQTPRDCWTVAFGNSHAVLSLRPQHPLTTFFFIGYRWCEYLQ